MQIRPDLRDVTPADHTGVRDRFVDSVSTVPGVVATYQFGAVTQPWISDLDLLVVVETHISPDGLRAIARAARLDDLTRYVLAHPPVVVPESAVEDIPAVHTLYNLRQIWGRRLDVPPRSAEESVRLAVADYVDFTFSARHVLRSLRRATTVGFRSVLLLLTSCAHSLGLASATTGLETGKGVADRVADLRAMSLRHPEESAARAEPAISDCLEALQEADAALERYVQSTRMMRTRPFRICAPHVDQFCLFSSPFQPSASHPDGQGPRKLIERLAGIDFGVEHYPGFYLAQFRAYAGTPGPYGMAHRTVFGPPARETTLDPAYRAVLTRRVHVVEEIWRVVGKGQLLPMVPLGIGFRRPDRIRRSHRHILLRPLVAPWAHGARG